MAESRNSLRMAALAAPVKVHMTKAASDATQRRLTIYQDKIPCEASCYGCCTRMIYISVAEALVMFKNMTESGKWMEVRGRCIQVKQIAMDSNQLSWYKMNIMCPVLNPDNHLCESYDVRPTACSTHFVTSHPSQCYPWSTTPGTFVPEDMDDIHHSFMSSLASFVDVNGILAYRMPIPIALLFAESIQTLEGLTLEEMSNIIRNELK